jgi:hypothetical protein
VLRLSLATPLHNESYWHIASFRRVAKFGRYWGKADMPNGFSEGATVKSLKAKGRCFNWLLQFCVSQLKQLQGKNLSAPYGATLQRSPM